MPGPWLRTRPPAKLRTGLVAAVDVGSTKVCCFIVRLGNGAARVEGIGHKVSRGVRSGAIVDMDAAEAAVRATVEAAERMAGENVRHAVVNLSAGQPNSRLVAYDVAIAGHEIGDADLRRVLDAAELSREVPDGHELVHAIPVGYSVDGHDGVHDPRGLFGERLGVNLHLISGATGAVRTMDTCLSRCHLDPAGQVFAPYASALGCLNDDERALGVVHIDMGGGTTSFAVFFDGEMIHADVIPVGGGHVTRDIAHGLSTPLAQAERIKTLFGSCLPSPSDDRQMIEVPPLFEDGAAEHGCVPRSMLVGIIRPRIEEIFEMVRARLDDAGVSRAAGRQVVLTGGASQLPGVADMAAMVLAKQVRPGTPRPIDGMAEAACGPVFATCAGLVRFVEHGAGGGVSAAFLPEEEPAGRLARLGQWIRENF